MKKKKKKGKGHGISTLLLTSCAPLGKLFTSYVRPVLTLNQVVVKKKHYDIVKTYNTLMATWLAH